MFLDANIVIAQGKPPGGPVMHRLIELASTDLIQIVTTDHSIDEIVKKFVENDYNAIKDFGRSHVRDILSAAFDLKLPAIDKDQIKKVLRQKYEKSVKELMRTLGARHASVEKASPSKVLSDYARETGFFSSEGKKDQFPDAFIFEALKTDRGSAKPLIIVSQDDDFLAPSKKEKDFSLVKSIPNLFNALGLTVDAQDIDEILDDLETDLTEKVAEEVPGWGLEAMDVNDAYIEILRASYTDIKEYTAFSPVETNGDILVIGTLNVSAEVSFEHPNWESAMYDSEDKCLYPFENVEGTKELDVEPDFEMTIEYYEDTETYAIADFKLRGDGWIYIDLHTEDIW